MKSHPQTSTDILLANLIPATGLILFDWNFHEFFFALSAGVIASGFMTILSDYTPGLNLDKKMRRDRTIGFSLLLTVLLFGIVGLTDITYWTIHSNELPKLVGFVVMWQFLQVRGLYFAHTQREVYKLIGIRFLTDLLSFALLIKLFSELEQTFHTNNPSLILGVAFLLKAVLEFYVRQKQTKSSL